VRFQVLTAESMRMIVFWDAAPCSLIVLLMEAASTSETSVNFYETTRRNIPEDSHLHKIPVPWFGFDVGTSKCESYTLQLYNPFYQLTDSDIQ
jgi:hypothetical protein